MTLSRAGPLAKHQLQMARSLKILLAENLFSYRGTRYAIDT